MAKNTLPSTDFFNRNFGGYKVIDILDCDVLLYKMGDTMVESDDYEPAEATRVIAVEFNDWDGDQGPNWTIKGEIFVFGMVLREELGESPYVVGTIVKPKKAYQIRNLSPDKLEKARVMWPQIWPELEKAANEAETAFAARQASGAEAQRTPEDPEY